MEKNLTNLYGLLGKNISYSFSKGYFTKKFEELGLTTSAYQNFDIQDISEIEKILSEHPNLKGLNVTIPYKEQVLSYLNNIDETAKTIGAVNTIKIKNNNLIGYNTDAYGFENSLKPLLKSHHQKALILGTGGASKAVAFVLKKLNIPYQFVSRSKSNIALLTYDDLNELIILNHQIIINCTPLGTSPHIDFCPQIPYQFLTNQHILYDLIYNPAETKFLQLGKQQGAIIKNGLEMLILQAEKAYSFWNS